MTFLFLSHLRSILVSPCDRGSACSGRWILWTEQALMGSRTLIMAPEKHPTRGKDRYSQCTVNLQVFGWNTCVPLHVSDFLCIPCHFSSSSHLKDSSSTQQNLTWSNFLSSFFILSYFWDHFHLLSWCPDAFSHPTSTAEWPLLNVFSDLLDIRLSLIIFGPAFIVPP